jgi:hypothetical protein
LSRWSCPELAREVVGRSIAEAMSASTVWRWLAREAVKPWQYRSWLFPRAPDLASKAERVLELYERRWQGRKLGPREYVICSDEKTSIQARCRCHPSLAPGQARMMRVNHEYGRAARWPIWPPTTCTRRARSCHREALPVEVHPR